MTWLEGWIKRYLAHFHGSADDPSRQYQYYRCEMCRHLVTWKQIARGGCICGVSSRVRAAHLTFLEKAQLLVLPWTV